MRAVRNRVARAARAINIVNGHGAKARSVLPGEKMARMHARMAVRGGYGSLTAEEPAADAVNKAP